MAKQAGVNAIQKGGSREEKKKDPNINKQRSVKENQVKRKDKGQDIHGNQPIWIRREEW